MKISYDGLPLWVATVKGYKCKPTKAKHEIVRYEVDGFINIIYTTGKGSCPKASELAGEYVSWLLAEDAKKAKVTLTNGINGITIDPTWSDKEKVENILQFLEEDLGLIEPGELMVKEIDP